MVNLVTCLFSLFEALNDAFEVQFFRALVLHLTKDTDSMYGHAAQIFFKVKTLLTH